MGNQMKVGRPRQYEGDGPTSGAGPIATIPGLPPLNIAADDAQKLQAQLEERLAGKEVVPPSEVLEVKNMLTQKLINDRNELDEIAEEMFEECKDYGTVIIVRMPEANSTTEDSVHVRMKTADEAMAAITKLNGRTFDGRQLSAKYFPVKDFEKLDKTTTSYSIIQNEPKEMTSVAAAATAVNDDLD